jgi:hypothetical protein
MHKNVKSQGICNFLTVLQVLLNHHLSQKLKLIERDKFNHLINTLTLSLAYGLRLSIDKAQHVEYLIEIGGK